jgi:hypothetical protein
MLYYTGFSNNAIKLEIRQVYYAIDFLSIKWHDSEEICDVLNLPYIVIISYEVFGYGHHTIWLNSDHIWPYHTTGHNNLSHGFKILPGFLSRLNCTYNSHKIVEPAISIIYLKGTT